MIPREYDAAVLLLTLHFELYHNPEQMLAFVEKLIEEHTVRQAAIRDTFFEGKQEFSLYFFHGLLTILSNIVGEPSNFGRLVSADPLRAAKLYSSIISQLKLNITFVKDVIMQKSLTPYLDLEALNSQGDHKKEHFKKLFEKIESVNTTLDYEDAEDEKAAEIQTTNTAVAAFHLLAKDSGVFFSRILNLVVHAEKDTLTSGILGVEHVNSMLEAFTQALLYVQHRGAIDKIAFGIGDFCTHLHDIPKVEYHRKCTELLQKIMASLDRGECQPIYRRSAGLPHAVAALLKAEPLGMKHLTFPRVYAELERLALNDHKQCADVRIHALNILGVIFQDAQLKPDLEQYLGRGLELAIKGFPNDDWSIRNSSLMLYSAIMRKLFPNISNKAQEDYKSGLTVGDFFELRAPKLLNYFLDEITDFSSKKSDLAMYPTLYPISLILSKLRSCKTNQADQTSESVRYGDSNSTLAPTSPTDPSSSSIQAGLSKFRDLLLSCSGTSNFLGRVLVAKATVPFVGAGSISAYLDSIIPKSLAEVRQNHNAAHGRLLIAKFVISNYKRTAGNADSPTQGKEKLNSVSQQLLTLEEYTQICEVVASRQRDFVEISCPPVLLVYLEIVHILCEKSTAFHEWDAAASKKYFSALVLHCTTEIESQFSNLQLRNKFDICYGELRKQFISIVISRAVDDSGSSTSEQAGRMLRLAIETGLKHGTQLNQEDTDLLEYTFKYSIERFSSQDWVQLGSQEKIVSKLLQLLDSILSTNKKLVNLVKYIFEILSQVTQSSQRILTSEENCLFQKLAKQSFRFTKPNPDFMKDLIRVAVCFMTK